MRAEPEQSDVSTARQMLNKVPEVTIWFWVIKIMATTVGETAADFLSDNLGLGLTGTTMIMTVALAAVLVFQFRARKYVPSLYWLAVVGISIVGTLITDNLVDNFGVSLWTTTTLFAIALAITFSVWYRSEHTLSIHTINTTKREAFYWCAILFTFALGTAAGDLIAEKLNLGYWKSALLFGGCILLVVIAWRYFKLNPVLAFWMAYILTRPLGASIGDYLSQKRADGGLGLGTTGTTILFLSTILGVVLYLTYSKRPVRGHPCVTSGSVPRRSPSDGPISRNPATTAAASTTPQGTAPSTVVSACDIAEAAARIAVVTHATTGWSSTRDTTRSPAPR